MSSSAAMLAAGTGSSKDQTSYRVYIKSDEHGWLPAKLVSHDADGNGGTVTVSVRHYTDQNQIQSDGDQQHHGRHAPLSQN